MGNTHVYLKITARFKITGLAPKQTAETHHFDDLRVDGFGEDAAGGGDVVDELVEAGALHLLALEVGHRVHEVEDDAALQQLVDEQVLLLRRRRVCRQSNTIQYKLYNTIITFVERYLRSVQER